MTYPVTCTDAVVRICPDVVRAHRVRCPVVRSPFRDRTRRTSPPADTAQPVIHHQIHRPNEPEDRSDATPKPTPSTAVATATRTDRHDQAAVARCARSRARRQGQTFGRDPRRCNAITSRRRPGQDALRRRSCRCPTAVPGVGGLPVAVHDTGRFSRSHPVEVCDIGVRHRGWGDSHPSNAAPGGSGGQAMRADRQLFRMLTAGVELAQVDQQGAERCQVGIKVGLTSNAASSCSVAWSTAHRVQVDAAGSCTGRTRRCSTPITASRGPSNPDSLIGSCADRVTDRATTGWTGRVRRTRHADHQCGSRPSGHRGSSRRRWSHVTGADRPRPGATKSLAGRTPHHQVSRISPSATAPEGQTPGWVAKLPAKARPYAGTGFCLRPLLMFPRTKWLQRAWWRSTHVSTGRMRVWAGQKAAKTRRPYAGTAAFLPDKEQPRAQKIEGL